MLCALGGLCGTALGELSKTIRICAGWISHFIKCNGFYFFGKQESQTGKTKT